MSDEKTEEKPDERLSKMAATIGRMQIEALVTSAGAIDPKAVAEIVAKSTKAEIDATGTVKIQMVDPETGDRLRTPNADAMTPGQFIAQMKAGDYGPLFKDGAPGKPKPKATGRLETDSNPFHRDTFNLTEQARLLKTDPNAARIYQAAAKGTLASNPFSKEGFNLTEQSRLLRESPEEAARMKAEIQAKERNPWKAGPEFNMTMQVLILKSDKAKAARMKAEALLADGPDKPKNYIFTPPVGSFKRMGAGN